MTKFIFCVQSLFSDINPKYMTIRIRLNYFLVIKASRLKHSTSEILKSIHCLFLSLNFLCFLGDLNENSVENLQEKGLGDLLHEELFCWLIWEEMASTITGSKDYIVNLQGEMYRSPELDLSLCQKWGEASSHISSNKSSGWPFKVAMSTSV